MASVYKGLTIQINGDTSKLTAALASANKAASETQTQLSKIGKALVIDPSNLTAAATKLNLVQNKATDLAASLQIAKTGASTLGDAFAKTGDAGTKIKDLAANTENAALNANLARQRYNEVNEQLAKIYTSTNSSARKTEELGSKWKEINNEPFKLEDYMRMTEDEASSLRTKMEEVGVSTKNWGTSAESTFTSLIGYLQNQNHLTEEQANKLTSMRSQWAQVANELDDAVDVQKFKNMNVQIQQTEAEVKKLVTEFSKVKISTDVAKNVKDIESRIESLDNDIERLKNTADQMDEALRLDPSDINAAATKTKALKEAAELAREKAALLGEEVEQLGKNSDVKKLAENTKDLSANFEKAKTKVEKTAEALAKAKAKAAEYESALKRLSTESGVDKTSDEFKQAEKNAQSAAAAVKIIEGNLKNVATEANNASAALKLVDTTNAQTSASAMAQSFTNAASLMKSTDWSSIGNDLTSTVTAALENVAGAALDMANDFDSAYRDMVKTVQGTEQEFDALKDAAIDFSSTHVTSASQILEIQAIGGELGLAAEDVQDFSEAISNISVATNIEDVETAANDLGSLANIMNDLSTDTFGSFSDALVRLGNNGASTESSIMDISQRIGSMASIVGMTTPEVLALASTIASTGQNSEAAGTAISNTMSDIETAVAASGDSLQLFADTAHMSAEEFANTWQSSPINAIKAFVNGLKDLESSGESADKRLEDLGITGVRQKQAIEGLMQTVDQLDDNLQMSSDAWNGVSDKWGQAGDAAREAEKKAEGLSGSLSKISNAAENVSSAFGDALTPIFSTISDIVADVSEAFIDLDDSALTGIATAGAVAAAAGPLITIFAAVSTALGSVAAPVAIAVAGLAALAGVAATVFSAWQEGAEHTQLFEDATKSASDVIDEATDKVTDLGDAYAGIEPDVDSALSALKDTNDALSENLSSYQENSAYLGVYMDTIKELAGQSSLTAYEQAQLTQAVEGYNEITGDTVSVVDAENGILSSTTDSIYANADAWKYNAEMQAYQNAVSGYIEAQTQATVARQIAQEKYNQSVDKQSQLEKELQDIVANGDKYTEEYYKKRDALREAEQATEDYKTALDEASEAEKTAAENAQIAQAGYEGLNENLSTLSQTFEGVPEQYQTLGTNISNALATGINNGKVESVDVATAWLKDSVITPFADTGTTMQSIGYTAAQGLATALSEGSIQVSDATNIMNAILTGDLDQVRTAYSDAGLDLPMNLASAIAANANLPADATQAAIDAVVLELTGGDTDAAAQLLGHEIDEGIKQGLEGSADMPTEAARVLTDDVIQAAANNLGIHSPSKEFADLGMYSDEGLAQGIENNAHLVETAGENLASRAESGMKSKNSLASSWGSDLGGNFASGISSMVGTVARAASSLASTVASWLHFTAPEEGPWSGAEKGGIRSGRHLAQNFAEGMTLGLSDVERAADKLAQAAQIDAKAGELVYEIKADQADQRQVQRQLADNLNSLLDAVAEAKDEEPTPQTVINQNVKVVRADADMNVAATILNRSAIREAGL